jgi:hypothetical protein
MFWTKILAVINPRITWQRIVGLVVGLPIGAGLAWLIYYYPWSACLTLVGFGSLTLSTWATLRAGWYKRQLHELRKQVTAEIAAGIAAELQPLKQLNEALQGHLATAQAAVEMAKERITDINLDRIEADRLAAAAKAETAEVRQRLDLSGQFVTVCLRWREASKSKKTPAKVNGTILDTTYWQKQIEHVAAARWPGYKWAPDELVYAAEQIADGLDLVRWRQVCNSEFGLTLRA